MNSKTVIYSSQAPAPIGPYSQAVWAGSMLFVSGQVAIDPKSNELIDGNIQLETHQVMRNLGAILEEGGITFDHVIKCSILFSYMNDF